MIENNKISILDTHPIWIIENKLDIYCYEGYVTVCLVKICFDIFQYYLLIKKIFQYYLVYIISPQYTIQKELNKFM